MTAKTSLNIFIENAYEGYETDEASLYSDVMKMAEFLFYDSSLISKSCISSYNLSSVTFDIVLVNDEEIRRINCDYRGIDAATDVISFAIFADSPLNERYIIDGDINLGEIIVSLDKVKAQSEENGVSFKDELYFIISHGMLHLLGFDHQCTDDYNFMVQVQRRAKAEVL